MKPQNILVSPDCTYKLCDFGNAKEVDFGISQTHTMVGTPLYLSPQLRSRFSENLRGTYSSRVVYDPFKSDVYSLALTVLYFVQLKPPHEFADIDMLSVNTGKVLGSLKVSDELRMVLRWMLQIDESQRPDFVQLKERLESRGKSGVMERLKCGMVRKLREFVVLPGLQRTEYASLSCARCSYALTSNHYTTSCGHHCCSSACFDALSQQVPCSLCYPR